MSKNKKKTAREKRILVGAFLTAVVIAAGSTFAWFTSTDTVTNRLSANADYDVKIVESFAPPENWLPGEKVDKDVYAVNTGSIEAFAKATVSGVMSMTREVPVDIATLSIAGTPATAEVPEKIEAWSNGTWEDITSSNNWDNITAFEISRLPAGVNNPTNNQATHFSSTGTGVDTTYTFYRYTAHEDAKPGTPDSYNYNDAVAYDANNADSKAKIYDCVQLKPEEVYVIEAGAYLAYKPDADNVNTTLGNKAIAFKEPTNGPAETKYYIRTDENAEWQPTNEDGYNNPNVSNINKKKESTGEDPTNYGKTDFTPHADGLYVFRRSIVVNTEGNAAGTETFEYDGYYYLGGRYYKIMNLNVTHDDVQDVAAEGDTRDGQLESATAYLVREEKVYDLEPKSFRYDAANNRIIASYATNTENGLVGDKDNLTDLAAALDEAEHDLQEAEVRLERAIADSGIVAGSVKDKTKAVDEKQKLYNDALAAYDRAVAAYKQALENYNIGEAAFDNAKAEAETAFKNLAGSGDTAKVTGTPATATEAETWTPDGDNGGTLSTGDSGYTIVAKGNQATDTTKLNATEAYGKALKAYNDWKTANLITQTSDGNTEAIDHQIYTYLKELQKDSKTGIQADPVNGNYYTAPSGENNFNEFSTDTVPNGVTHEDLVKELQYAARQITYKYAVAHIDWINWSAGGTGADNEFHRYHELLTALQIAENDYNNAVAAYNTAIGNLNKAINDLNSPVAAPTGSAFKPIDNTTEVTATYITTTLEPWDSGDAETLKTAYKTLKDGNATDLTEDVVTADDVVRSVETIQALTDANKPTSPSAEYTLWDAWQKLKAAEKDLAAVENQTYIKQHDDAAADNTGEGLPYEGPLYNAEGVPTNVDNPQVKENLKAAWDNYYTKKNAADELERRLNAAQNGFEKDGDLLIYIYLTDNVTLTGDTAGKWQLLPTDINANKEAVFYYTSILAGGEVSNQLIDYVELDKSANQDMYKYFDFDLNITLNSVQVGFDENGSRNTQPVNEEWQSVRAAIKDPTVAPVSGANTTVVTWSQNSTGGNTAPGGATYGEPSDEFNALSNTIAGYFQDITSSGGPVHVEPTKLQAPMQIPLEGNPVVTYSFTDGGKTYYTSNVPNAAVYEYADNSWRVAGTLTTT